MTIKRETFRDPFNVVAYLKYLFPGIEMHAQDVRLVQRSQDWPTIELTLAVDMNVIELLSADLNREAE